MMATKAAKPKKAQKASKADKPNKDNRQERQSRSASQIERDNLLVSNFYLQGLNQGDIATKVGIDQTTVSRTLKTLQAKWAEKSVMNIDARKRVELERIDLVEREAWQAWERSKGDKTEQLTRSKALPSVKDPSKLEVQPVTDIQQRKWVTEGNPKYLNVIMECVERRCKILGIDAPIKISEYKLTPQTPKPILRRVAAGIPIDVAYSEYASGTNKELYGE